MTYAILTKPASTILSYQSLSASDSTGRLALGQSSWPCVAGKTGCSTRKREGDLSTPIGRWPITTVHYRPDRVPRPITGLKTQALKQGDGWCDAAGDRNYNRAVTLPYPASCEDMWRQDHAYDICVELDYNIYPRSRGLGSAVFFHLIQPDSRLTEGCIAVNYRDMLQILQRLSKASFLRVL